jgi:nicotinamidase-related amidase
MAALVLVDLQVDFLEPKQDRPALLDARPFIRLLPVLIRAFTTRRLPIIWVLFLLSFYDVVAV